MNNLYNEFEDYFYEGTEVLKNKLGIKTEKELNIVERNIVQNKLATVSKITGVFDFQHLCNIHKHLFDVIYDWAGQVRMVEMCKDEPILNNRSVRYTAHSQIVYEAKDAILKLHKEKWDSLNIEQKADKLAEITSELWKVHPFREGNTRTVITFVTKFAEDRGFLMDKKIFVQNPESTRNALVLATNNENFTQINQIFKKSIEVAQLTKKSKETIYER